MREATFALANSRISLLSYMLMESQQLWAGARWDERRSLQATHRYQLTVLASKTTGGGGKGVIKPRPGVQSKEKLLDAAWYDALS